jgi:lysophospholipase L1-like esterase
MKTILCYGDSNTWGAVPMTRLDDCRRFGPTERWAGILRQELGADYHVIEEGLNGRTTVWDDPIEGVYKNGKTYLMPCLESHNPIDLVVLMLGTNDLKKRFSVSAFDISLAVEALVRIILSCGFGPNGTSPRVLLICPPPLTHLELLAGMFEGGTEKSRALAPYYRAVADRQGCAFLDAGQVIVSSEIDGIHFDPDSHHKLGMAVTDRVRSILKSA